MNDPSLYLMVSSTYFMVSSTTSRETRFWGKMLSRIYSHIEKLQDVIVCGLMQLERRPAGVIINIVDEDDSLFFRVPNREKVYYVEVGWQREGFSQPRDPISAIKLVARKTRQVFARARFVPIQMRQQIIHDVHEWEKAALAEEGAET